MNLTLETKHPQLIDAYSKAISVLENDVFSGMPLKKKKNLNLPILRLQKLHIF